MTPEELSKSIVTIITSYPDLRNISAREWDRIVVIIRHAKSEWCRKQRILIAKAQGYKIGTIGYESILAVPEPELPL
jgi:hypothetical protein